ncbi:MAG TPA: phospholipase D-like domain-containing protein [Rhodanobacteraceae bacterium]|nr:phospholipase D-like domain-containing protein [Rhodanobacteraceae bacterium]
MSPDSPFSSTPRQLAERAFSRAAGAPLLGGNRVDLLIDAEAHFDAWLAAIGKAQRQVLLENYLIRNDHIGRAFRDALVDRARAGVQVCVIRDWMGCFGQSRRSFWKPLLEAGGEVRVYGPPHPLRPLTFVSRDHRKMLVVDDTAGFLSGVCISAQWLGRPERELPPWRDTGVVLHGPVLAQLQHAFAESWASLGVPLPDTAIADMAALPVAGNMTLRLIATQPNTAGVYRLDHMIAAMARKTLWLTDAYFVGVAPYVQALASAAHDGVDVRLLVPGASDIPLVAGMSRAGYRPLLEAGVRVFEWKGSMLHAKTAVADGQWARVGSSNLNLASWLGNCELDVAIEDSGFAGQMQTQYENDLANATEIVLAPRRYRRGKRVHGERHHVGGHHGRGSGGRAAAGAMRLAHTVGAALTDRRVLGHAESTPLAWGALALLALGILGILWPAILGWPLAAVILWIAVSLGARWMTLRRRAARERNDEDD